MSILKNALACLVMIFAIVGCNLIVSFDYTEFAREFDGRCFQSFSEPEGVIVFDATPDTMGELAQWTISGRGEGLFGEPGIWVFSDVNSPSGTTLDSVTLQVTVSPTRTETVRAEALGGSVRLSELPTMVTSVELEPCADTVGVYDLTDQSVSLWNAPLDEAAQRTAAFELPSGPPDPQSLPVAGDWDGDGQDSYGVYEADSRTFYLADDEGNALAAVPFPGAPGGASLRPVAGDWNGNGMDSVGLFARDSAEFYLLEALDSVAALPPFVFGRPGVGRQYPVAGNWDGVGGDTVAVWDGDANEFLVTNSNNADPPDAVCSPELSLGGVVPVSGDWPGRHQDGLGLYHRSSGTFLLFVPGAGCSLLGDFVLSDAAGDDELRPMAGNWDGPIEP